MIRKTYIIFLVKCIGNVIVFYVIYNMNEWMLGALRKKQLTASFVEYFKENDENTTYVYFAEVI